MSNHYDEAMVTALKKSILDNFHPPTDRFGSWHIRPDEMARDVLDTVAPLIAAKALRDAAITVDNFSPDRLTGVISRAATDSIARWLEARADVIEAQS